MLQRRKCRQNWNIENGKAKHTVAFDTNKKMTKNIVQNVEKDIKKQKLKKKQKKTE